MRKLFALKDSSLLGQPRSHEEANKQNFPAMPKFSEVSSGEASNLKIESISSNPSLASNQTAGALARGRGRPKKLPGVIQGVNQNEGILNQSANEESGEQLQSNMEGRQLSVSRNSNKRNAHIETPLLSPAMKNSYGEAFRFEYIPRANSDKPRMVDMEANLHILRVMKDEADPLKPYLSKHCERYFYHTMYQLIDYSRRTSPLKFCYHCYSFRHRDSRKDQKFAARFVSDMFPYEDETEELIQAHWHSFLTHTIDYFVDQDIVRTRDDGSLEFRLPSIGKCTSAHKENVQGTVCKFTIFYKDKIELVETESPNHSTYLPWGKTKTYDESLRSRRPISRHSNSSNSDCTFLKIGASDFLAASPLYSSSVSSGINFIQSNHKPAQQQFQRREHNQNHRQDACSWSPPSHAGMGHRGFNNLGQSQNRNPLEEFSIEVDTSQERDQFSGNEYTLDRDGSVQQRELGQPRTTVKPTVTQPTFDMYQKRFEQQYYEPGDSESTAASRMTPNHQGRFGSRGLSPEPQYDGFQDYRDDDQQDGQQDYQYLNRYPDQQRNSKGFLSPTNDDENHIPPAFLNSQPLVMPKRRYGCRGFLNKVPVRIPTRDDLEEIDEYQNRPGSRLNNSFGNLGKRRVMAGNRNPPREVDIDVDEEIERFRTEAAFQAQRDQLLHKNLEIDPPNSQQEYQHHGPNAQKQVANHRESVESIDKSRLQSHPGQNYMSRIDPEADRSPPRRAQSSHPQDHNYDSYPQKRNLQPSLAAYQPGPTPAPYLSKSPRPARKNPWLHNHLQSSSSSAHGHYRTRNPAAETLGGLHVPRFRIDDGENLN